MSMVSPSVRISINFGFFDNNPDNQTGFLGDIQHAPSPPQRFGGSLLPRYRYANRLPTIGARLTSCGTPSAHGCGAPSRRRNPVGTLIMKPIWQFGGFGSANIRAWSFASETGYKLPTLPLKPRFSLRADISSGDNPRTNTLGTFFALFPVGNYFGILQDTGPGPINFIDVQPRVETVFSHDVSVMRVLLLYWRKSLDDGVYGLSGTTFLVS